jgi:hypothetical protein
MDIGNRNITDLTVKELKQFVRQTTKELNKAFYDISAETADLKKDYPLLYEQRNRLIELGTGKEYRGGIGVGIQYRITDPTTGERVLRDKTKAQLIQQARALRETKNILETPEAREEIDTATYQAYQTFKNNRPGIEMSYADYKDMVNQIGSMGEHVFREFGYESFIEKYDEARSQGKGAGDIAKAVSEAQRVQQADDSKAYTPMDMVDLLNDLLNLGGRE